MYLRCRYSRLFEIIRDYSTLGFGDYGSWVHSTWISARVPVPAGSGLQFENVPNPNTHCKNSGWIWPAMPELILESSTHLPSRVRVRVRVKVRISIRVSDRMRVRDMAGVKTKVNFLPWRISFERPAHTCLARTKTPGAWTTFKYGVRAADR